MQFIVFIAMRSHYSELTHRPKNAKIPMTFGKASHLTALKRRRIISKSSIRRSLNREKV